MKRILFGLSFILLTLHLQAQILKTESPHRSILQFQKSEWEISLKAQWKNPYSAADITLDMNILSPSGRKLVLPCFFVSGNSGEISLWKARFTARETGLYSCYFTLMEKGRLVSSSPESKFMVNLSEGKGFLNSNDLWTLKYDNGELFRGIGENICWESRDEDDSKYFKALHEDKRFNYQYMLSKLKANGGNFFRTWMIYWNLPVDWKIVSNNSRYQNTDAPYNESGMNRLDQLLELCDSLGIHMMLALESHVGYMGDGWKMSSYYTANGGPAETPLEFFTLPEARQQYKDKLRLMVARYGYSPAIAAWEFFNEIDNAMYNVKPEDQLPASVITDWHNEMSTFLKDIDPYKHLVTTSVSHRDIEGLNDLKNMDINQRHIYKNTAAIPSTINDYTEKYKKPYVIGESGYEWDWSKNFNDFAFEMDLDFKRALWLGLFSPTPVLPMSWWWEFFENRGMMEYFKRINEINHLMLEAGKGRFESFQVKIPGEGSKAYGVKCGEKYFIYLCNSAGFDEGIEFSATGIPVSAKKLSCYNCDTGISSDAGFKILPDKNIRIDKMKLQPNTDLILIFE
jgi:hypothetical protein